MDVRNPPPDPVLISVLAKLNSSLALTDVLSAIMDGARMLMQAEASTLWLYDPKEDSLFVHTPSGPNNDVVRGHRLERGTGIGWRVFSSREPYLTNNPSQDPFFSGEIVKSGFTTRNLLTVPLISSGGPGIGVLQVLNRPGGFDPARDVPLFRLLADQAAVAIEREQMHAALKENEAQRHLLELTTREQERLQDTGRAAAFARGVEEERSRLARELHDAVLGRMSMVIRGLQPVFQQNGDGRQWLEELQELSAEIRRVMDDLKPGVLEHFGLVAALESLLEKTCSSASPEIRLFCSIEVEQPAIDPDKHILIYRIFQEAASNLIRHAGAREVHFSVKPEKDRTRFELRDNGSGFDVQAATGQAVRQGGGNGLRNLRHRAAMAGASLVIESVPGRGTSIVLLV